MLRRAVASVLAQTEGDFELIVIDDATRDADFGWIGELNDSRVRMIRNAERRGVAYTRNVGLAAASGTYISFLDDDDEYLDSFLSSTHACLKDTPPTVAMSWCGVRYLDYLEDAGGKFVVRENDFSAACHSRAEVIDNLLSIGTGCGVTIKSGCLRVVGGFNSTLTTVEDIDLFLRIILHNYTAAVIPGVHMVVHNHRDPRLTDVTLHQTRIRECEWLLISYQDFLGRQQLISDRLFEHINLLKEELSAGEGRFEVLSHGRAGWPSMGRWR